MNNVDEILTRGNIDVKPENVPDDKEDIIASENEEGIDAKISERKKEPKVRSEVQKEIDPDVQNAADDVEDESIDPKNPVQDDGKPSDSANEDKEHNKEDEEDEYGNKVTKQKKTYTEEEVQNKIRERLARVRQEQQPTQDEKKTAANTGFEYDENSEQDWRTQLKAFVKETYSEIDQENKEFERKSREQKAHDEFQSKFNSGMSKYPDFIDTLRDKPVTDAMVMATRSMENPAAFLYAAAKKYPDELSKNSTTQSARPMDHDKSDVTEKVINTRPSIESLIDRHARSRRR
jgi:hypothetical protein